MRFGWKVSIFVGLASLVLVGCGKVNLVKLALKEGDAVVTLDLSEAELTKFPGELAELKNMAMLNVNRNSIPSIPAEIGGFKALESLLASQNRAID